MSPFDVYKTYIGIKNHFTKKEYDYHRYNGKVKASISTFNKRKDRIFFERMSRQKNDSEILDFFVSNFSYSSDPQSLWIGEIIKNGEDVFKKWKRKIESLSYVFKEEISENLTIDDCNQYFKIDKNRHPTIFKLFLQNKISIETLIILNKLIKYKGYFDSNLKDPVWMFTSMKIDKYSSFLYINEGKFKTILKESLK